MGTLHTWTGSLLEKCSSYDNRQVKKSERSGGKMREENERENKERETFQKLVGGFCLVQVVWWLHFG